MKKSILQLVHRQALFIVSGLILTLLFRMLFYFVFKTPDLESGIKLPTYAILHGLRFDLSALFFLNIIFFLFIYFRKIRTNKYFLNLWAFISAIYGFILLADFTYYSLYSSRIGWDFLAVFNGLNLDIFTSMFLEFLVLIPVLFLIFYLNRYFLYKFILPLNFNLDIRIYPFYVLVLLVVALVGIRGGFQKRVLSPQHTWLYANGNSFFATMTSNPLHNLIRSKRSSTLPKGLESSNQMYLKSWNSKLQEAGVKLDRRPKNVLFIFIESWSSFSFEHDKMPELNKWMIGHSKDLQFTTDFYANGNLSKDALLSVYFGLPSYFNVHFFESKYAKNKLMGIGQIAKMKSMDSFFLHAAPAGTQFFDVISKAAGFNTYKSIIDNFKGEEKLKGTWGVHDEALYKASLDYISNLEKPFLGTLFTTSTHTPFKGTPNNNLETTDVELNYFSAINYVDKSLVDFFNKASKQKWFKDTLFIVTGDHSPPLSTDWNRSLKEQSRIPFLMFWPDSNLENINFRKIGRHVDIPKTVFDLLGVYPASWTPYGESLIKSNSDESHVFYTNSNSINLVLASKDVITQPFFDEGTKVFDAKINHDHKEIINKTFLELKDYVYRLEKNSIY